MNIMNKNIIILGHGPGKSDALLALHELRETGIRSDIVVVNSMDRDEMKELSADLVSMRTKEVRQRIDVELQIHSIVENPIHLDEKRQPQQGWKKKYKLR